MESIKLADNVYHLYESNGVYCTLITGSERALLIDTGFGCGDIAGSVSAITGKPVLLVNTHGHFDHIQANHLFPEAHIGKADVRLLKVNGDLVHKIGFLLLFLSKASSAERKQYVKNIVAGKRRIAEIEDGHVFDLGDMSIKAVLTPGHTQGSLCFMDETNRFIYSGDSVSNHVWLCFDESSSIPAYVRTLERLVSLTDDSYEIVSSHSGVPHHSGILQKLIHCCENARLEESTPYIHPFCKNAFMYGEGGEEGVSIVYRKDKLSL